ncbi:MAG TPA: thiol reductant ABC exporter subunit CydD [Caulobacteraceae bacterium]|jgi:ATP-binding cassette subfamily C protein CydD
MAAANFSPRQGTAAENEAWLRRRRGQARGPLALATTAGGIGGILLIPQAWLLARAVDAVTIEGRALADVWRYLVPLLGVLVLRAVANAAADGMAAAAAARIKRALRAQLFDRIAALGPAWMRAQRSGEISGVLVDGVEGVEKYFANYLPQRTLTAFVPLAILVAVFPKDWISGLILTITAPILLLFMVIVGKGAESLNQRQWRRLALLGAHFFDVLEGLTTLKLFNASRREADTIARISDEYRETTMEVLRVAFLSSLVLEFFATIGVAMVAVFIGFRLLTHHMDFLPGFFALLLAPEFYRPLREMGAQHHARGEAIGAADGLIACLELAAPEGADDRRRSAPAGEPLRIRFEGVGFTYAESGVGVQDISFTLAQGECVALVGPSGAGKTTIGRLLMGFLEPVCGRVLVNGIDLSEIDPAEWRARLGWMPQRSTLFFGSVAENIRLGDPAASPEAVAAAAEAAAAAEFIEALPDGFDTRLGDAGQGLSGGQIQRVALARLFLKHPDVLVLDEATAALDRETAARVIRALRRRCAHSAMLFITHDLEVALAADRVLVLEDGRIVEAAMPDALSYGRLSAHLQERAA